MDERQGSVVRSARRSLLALVLTVVAIACSPRGGSGAGGQPIEAIGADFPTRALPAAEAKDKTAAPLSLTASDGTGLRMASFKAEAVVQEPLALTQLHLTFDNPEDRTIEGRFAIDLPPGAAISRFAMKIGGRWQEGEVVERQAARVAYEDFLHRKQDPALLEKQAGNRFSARVFPIPARARKELMLSYSQELTDSREPYRLMLRGLPELETLDVRVVLDRAQGNDATSLGGEASSRRTITLKKTKFVPDSDLEVPAAAPSQAMGIRHENLALARVAAVGSMPPDPIGDLTVLFDTSASRGLGFAGQLHRLADLVEALHAAGDFRLRVVAFDQEASTAFDGQASQFDRSKLQPLYDRRALGASDLSHALRRLEAAGQASKRVLLVSDGIATAGASEAADLKSAVVALGEAGVERLDALIDGGLQDRDTLEALTTAGLARDGIVVDARTPAPQIAEKLALGTASNIAVSVPGSEWSWPATASGLQPGDELLVYANLPAETPMTVVLEGKESVQTKVELTKVSKPLLERAWIGAQIDKLTLERSKLGSDEAANAVKKTLQDQVVGLSTKHRVLSDFTALLVLETERDYTRFNIDRNALSDILVVGKDGVELVERKQMAFDWGTIGIRQTPMRLGQATASDDPRFGGILDGVDMSRAWTAASDDEDVWGGLQGTEIGEAIGDGGLGLSGTGRGGGGAPAKKSRRAKAEEGSMPSADAPLDTGRGTASPRQAEEGTIGLGNLGVMGKGGGGGGGSAYGRGSGSGFRGRVKSHPRVRPGKARVDGPLDKEIVRRIVRRHLNEVRFCYEQRLVERPKLKGTVTIGFAIDGNGAVSMAEVEKTSTSDKQVGKCMVKAFRSWRFPRPLDGGTVKVSYPFELEPGGGPGGSRPHRVAPEPPPPPPTPEELEQLRRQEAARIAAREHQQAMREAEQKRREDERRRAEAEAERTKGSPYEGRMYDVMILLKSDRADEALEMAAKWQDESPGDVLALIALGEALEAKGKPESAARAYGSLIDLFPARADLRRYAGARLERLGKVGMALAADSYARAVEQRADHPASHRLHAYALVRAGRPAEAFDAIVAGAKRDYPSGRFAAVDRILKEDVGLIAAAWIKAEPTREDEIRSKVSEAGATVPKQPSTRFVMTWETDANDVDFHIKDAKNNEAYYSIPRLETGGELYADVTTGYGPECFTIEGVPAAFPYKFEAKYFSRGPMGYGMGKLQILQHDGKGTLSFDDRPYLIMKDRAFVELGTLDAPLK